MKRICLFVLLLLATAVTVPAETGEHLLLQRPAVSQTSVAFVFAGDLWVVGRGGGEASRLTTGTGIETTPYFSPDGTMIAFTGQYDGNTDVYVMPSSAGGDALPFYFRETNTGPLVGKRTWGGLVGIYGEPSLMDGGQVTAPRVAFFSSKGEWEVENRGVAPDIEVDLDPQSWRAGRDPQLEKAVEVVMEALKKNPPPAADKPAYPNYHRSQAQQ